MVKMIYPKRAIFPKGQQSKFLLKAIKKLRFSWFELAKKINIHTRTLNDWKREQYSMPIDRLKKICGISGMKIPSGIKIKDPFWYAKKGAELGGLLGSAACIKKYGSVGGPNRERGWDKWWNEKGKFSDNPLFRRKPINKPKRTQELAEFIGIMLGDGGIGAKGKQIHITLNSRDDAEYIKYVCGIIEKLFKRKPGICDRKSESVFVISVSSMDLIDFLIELGLKKGNKIKLQVDIPDWIKNNKLYSIACARGLMDTDGCVFNHSYKVNGKAYSYKKLSFTSYSQPMLKSFNDILKSVGIKARLFHDRDVRIDSVEDAKKYFMLIGSHNPKHLNKYYK